PKTNSPPSKPAPLVVMAPLAIPPVMYERNDSFTPQRSEPVATVGAATATLVDAVDGRYAVVAGAKSARSAAVPAAVGVNPRVALPLTTARVPRSVEPL